MSYPNSVADALDRVIDGEFYGSGADFAEELALEGYEVVPAGTADRLAAALESVAMQRDRQLVMRDELRARLSALTDAIGNPDQLRQTARMTMSYSRAAGLHIHRIAAAVQPPTDTPPPTDEDDA